MSYVSETTYKCGHYRTRIVKKSIDAGKKYRPFSCDRCQAKAVAAQVALGGGARMVLGGGHV